MIQPTRAARTGLTLPYDLTGTAQHRDAQLRHALIRLLHWAQRHHLAIAVEDLDFRAEKTREKHGRRKRFRNLVSGLPTSRLRARLLSMAAELGIPVIAVDPACTSRWGAQHWHKPLTGKNSKTTRHHAAAVAIGRRALGHPIRRRTAPPPAHRSDEQGHRTVQADSVAPGSEGTRPRIPGPRTRSVRAGCGPKAGDQNARHRSGRSAEHEFWETELTPAQPLGTVPSGSRTVNVVVPGSLVRSMVPPWALIRERATARPRPLPPRSRLRLRLRALSTR